MGGGQYFDANDDDQLRAALRDATQLKYQLVQKGVVIADGLVNGPALEVAPGNYDLQFGNSENSFNQSIQLGNGEKAQIELE